MDIDSSFYADTVQKALSDAEELFSNGANLTGAIEALFAVEKQTRLGSDPVGNGKVLNEIVRMCLKFPDNFTELKRQITLMIKKRALIKTSISSCFDIIMEYLNGAPSSILMEIVKEGTEGKLYLEVQCARASMMLSKWKEEQEGDVEGAAHLLQEVPVETFTSLERRERITFILEQIRLSLAVKEHQKALIMSRKLNQKALMNDSDLKLSYFRLMTNLALTDSNPRYLDCCEYLLKINTILAEAASIDGKDESTEKDLSLKMAIIFAVLAEETTAQKEIMSSLSGRIRELDSLPVVYKELLKTFQRSELIRLPAVQAGFSTEMTIFEQSLARFSPSPSDAPLTDVRWKHLGKRILEHNVKVIAKYYFSIRIDKMAKLLEISFVEAEDLVGRMVVQSALTSCKIDQIKGVIYFEDKGGMSPAAVVGNLNGRIKGLLGIVSHTCHQVSREEMIYGRSN